MHKIEQDYALAFESNPLPMWVIDVETMRFVEVNEASLRQYGYGRDEFLALTLRDVRPPHAVPLMLERWQQAVAMSIPGKPYSVGPTDHRRKNGSDFVADITVTPIDFRGRKSFLSVQVDVTDRVHAEQQARADRERFELISLDQRRRLKAIFDNAQDALVITSSNNRFLDANPAACQMFGYSREELLALQTWDLVLEELNDEYRQRMRQLMLTGRQDAEGQGRRKDGTVVEVEYRSVANIEPGVHLTVIRDITRRRHNEKVLLEQKGRLQALFDYAQDGIVFVNDEGRYIDANPAACEIYGYTHDELRARAIWDLAPREDGQVVRERFRRLLELGRQSGEARRVRKDGTVIELEYRAVANIEPGVHLTVLRDVTKRRHDEESLRHLSGRLLRLQDEERRRLARELHDSTAQSLAALALELAIVGERGEGLEPRARHALAEAERIADQCSRELRTLSYLLHPPLLDEMGLSSALNAYVEGFSKRSGVEVELVTPPDIVRLSREDETTLFRIVQECLTNVHRHSMSPTARVSLTLEPDAVRLEVSDQGRGIAPRGAGGAEERHELGVGIAGMKERVHQLGGDLELDSSASGLTVRAFLPRRQP